MSRQTPGTESLHPVPVLLDTDIGTNIDDALALAYLLRHPRCELLGITTVSGDVAKRAACAEVLCFEAGRDDVPIQCGAPGPLLSGPGQPAVPLYASIARRRHTSNRPVGTALEFLRCVIRDRPREIILLTIGPFTNVALLFSLDPELPTLLRGVVSMAGVYFPHERPVETNVLIDPVAAAMVFRATAKAAAAPHTLVGLSVTTRCTLRAAEVQQRVGAAVPPAGAVLDMAQAFFRHKRHATFNDPLAAAIVFHPELCSYESGAVTMTHDRPAEESARTYFAPDRARPGHTGNHRVARGVRLEKFFAEYFDTLCGTLSGGTAPSDPDAPGL